MDWPTGCTPSGSGILIRWGRGKGRKSEKLELPHDDRGKRKAARIRAERIKEQKFGKPVVKSESIEWFDLCQRWLTAMRKDKDWSQSTYDGYRNILQRYWLPPFDGKYADQITYEDIDAVWESYYFSTKKTAKNVLGPLKGVTAFGFRKNLMSEDLGKRFHVVASQAPEKDPFTPEEKESILSALAQLEAEEKIPEGVYLYWLAVADTGMRTPSEPIALTWPMFDGRSFRVKETTVRRKSAGRTKTKKARRVVVTSRLKEALANHYTRFKKRHIFLDHRGEPYKDADELNNFFYLACDLAKVRKRRPYNLRHSYATHGLDQKIKPVLLARQLGHTLETFWRNYATEIEKDDDDDELLRIENAQQLDKGAGVPPMYHQKGDSED